MTHHASRSQQSRNSNAHLFSRFSLGHCICHAMPTPVPRHLTCPFPHALRTCPKTGFVVTQWAFLTRFLEYAVTFANSRCSGNVNIRLLCVRRFINAAYMQVFSHALFCGAKEFGKCEHACKLHSFRHLGKGKITHEIYISNGFTCTTALLGIPLHIHARLQEPFYPFQDVTQPLANTNPYHHQPSHRAQQYTHRKHHTVLRDYMLPKHGDLAR